MRTVKDALRPPISESMPARPTTAETDDTPSRSMFERMRDSKLLRTMTLGAYALSAATSAYMLADDGVDRLRADRSFSVESLHNQEAKEKFPHTSWIIMPGIEMAWHDSEEVAWAMEPAMQDYGQIAWMGYKNTGIDEEAIIQSVVDYTEKNDINKLMIYGHSMGGPLSLVVAEFFHENPQYGVDVAGILLDSPPADSDDILKQMQLTAVASGSVGPILYAIVRQKSLSSGDNLAKLSESLSQYALDFDVKQATANLPDDLVVMYAGSKNDELINTATAIPKWKDALGDKLNVVYDSSPAGHASPRGGGPDREIYMRIVRLMGMATSDNPEDIERFIVEPEWVQPTYGLVPR